VNGPSRKTAEPAAGRRDARVAASSTELAP